MPRDRPRWPHASPRQQAAVRRDAQRQAARFAERPVPTQRYQGWLPRFVAETEGDAGVRALIAWYESDDDPGRPYLDACAKGTRAPDKHAETR